FLQYHAPHPNLHSFPTRRSSDLNQFAKTKYGQTLKSNVRYSSFKTPDIPNEIWEKTLGSDVNNLTHLTLTRGLMGSFLRHCANPDRKSTRLNSSHRTISYAVFCL